AAAVSGLPDRPDGTGDRVAPAQPVPLDLGHRHVHVVGAGEVSGRADERVVVQHVHDAGHRDEHLVLADLRLAATTAATAAAAAAALGAVAAPAVAVPE